MVGGPEKNTLLPLDNSRCRRSRQCIHLKPGHDPVALRLRTIERGFDYHLADHPWRRKRQQQSQKGGKCREERNPFHWTAAGVGDGNHWKPNPKTESLSEHFEFVIDCDPLRVGRHLWPRLLLLLLIITMHILRTQWNFCSPTPLQSSIPSILTILWGVVPIILLKVC
jgi:hypothetical protein